MGYDIDRDRGLLLANTMNLGVLFAFFLYPCYCSYLWIYTISVIND